MKINKLSRVLIVLAVLLSVSVGFLSYHVQDLRAENGKLKFNVKLSNEIIDDLTTSESILEYLVDSQSKLLNKVQRENIELTK